MKKKAMTKKTIKTRKTLRCRFCGTSLKHVFADLGSTPLSNSNLTPEDLNKYEVYYPLKVFVCDKCFLVQLPEHESADKIFTQEYAYFSSYSTSWLKHAEDYVEYITERLNLDTKSQVIEIASNDGYLLQYFLPKNIPVLGIDPAANTAKVAVSKGIPTLIEFFGTKLVKKLITKKIFADLIIGNNVLAHTPSLNDLVAGMKMILKPQGVITMEFPHLLKLMEGNQFDTIYHEHYSYFSFIAVGKVFAKHGLTIFDVEELPTHGGSLRIFAKHTGNRNLQETESAKKLVEKEKEYGFEKMKTYTDFQSKIIQTKLNLLEFIIGEKKKGKTFVGYGAPAKGNTFLNYCGIRTDLLEYTVDKSPHKQGLFLPGTRIPIYPIEKILETKPDYIFILPWNLQDEIMNMQEMKKVKRWGGKFFVAIPEVKIYG